MELPARRQTPTVRLRRLANELRTLRTDRELTREDVAAQTNINEATLYRLETAKGRPQKRTLLTLLDFYHVANEAKRAELITLSRQAAQLGWLQQFDEELPEEYTAYISFEAEARSVRNYESLFVPGLLQTENYARAVVSGAVPAADVDYVERRVEARLKRQTALTRKERPLQLWAIMDEAALHRQVGGKGVMVEQLRHLIDVGKQPNIVVQVVPYKVGAHPGMPGSFALMDFPEAADPELVYLDSMAGDLFLEREPGVRRFAGIFEHLQAAAPNPADSVRLIQEVTATLKNIGEG